MSSGALRKGVGGGLLAALGTVAFAAAEAAKQNEVLLNIEVTQEHPRSSEGSFVRLKSGRINLYYNQFTGLFDDSRARIVEIHSDDEGRTWSEPRIAIDDPAAVNVMCP